jgi:hypothetical protein
MEDKFTLENTRRAVAEYDANLPALDKMLWDAQSDAEVIAWKDASRLAKEKVKEAFYQDTKDRNSRENCHLVPVNILREMVARLDAGEL